MSGKIRKTIKKKLKQVPDPGTNTEKGFGLKTVKALTNIKAADELHVPTKLSFPKEPRIGEIIYNPAGKGKFYGTTSLSSWGSINTGAASLAEVLTKGNNAAGQDILGVNTAQAGTANFDQVNATSATINSLVGVSIITNVLTASVITSPNGSIETIYSTSLISGTLTATSVSTSTLSISEIYTGTFSGSNFYVNSVSASFVYADTFTTANYVWGFGNTFTIGELVTGTLTATNITGVVVPQYVRATFAYIEEINTFIAGFSGTVSMDGNSIGAENIYADNINSTLATGATLVSTRLVGNVLSASIANVSNVVATTATAFTISIGGALNTVNIYTNSLTATTVTLSSGGSLLVENLYAGTISGNSLAATVISATIATFNSVFTNNFQGTATVNQLTVGTITISGLATATLSTDYLTFYEGHVNQSTLRGNISTTNVFVAGNVGATAITSTIASGSTLTIQTLFTNAITATVSNLTNWSARGITVNHFSGTTLRTNWLTLNGASVGGTMSLGSLSGGDIFATNFYANNTSCSVVTVSSTLNVNNLAVTTVNVASFTFTTLNVTSSLFTVNTIYDYYGENMFVDAITATNISGGQFNGGEFRGNFVGNLVEGVEQISYPTATLSSVIPTSMIIEGEKGLASWGARVTNIDDELSNLGISTNNDSDIVVGGTYLSPLIIYNRGGTLSIISLPLSGAFVVKYNSAGIAQWGARISDALGNDTSLNNSGDIVIVGYYSGVPICVYNTGGITAFTLDNSGVDDAFIVKYNSAGIAQWGTRVAGIGNDYGLSVAINDVGDIIATGWYNNTILIYNAGGTLSNISLPYSGASYDTFIAKWNSAGKAQWGARIAGDLNDRTFGIALNVSGDIVVTGVYNSDPLQIYNAGGTFSNISLQNSGSSDGFIVKYNSYGIAQWATKISNNGNEDSVAISINDTGHIVVAGNFNSGINIYNAGGTLSNIYLPFLGSVVNTFLAKYTSAGVAEWAASIGGNNVSVTGGIKINNQDIITVNGAYDSHVYIYNKGGTLSNINLPFSWGNSDAFLVKYNSTGEAQWASQIGGTSDDYGYDIALNNNGDIIVSGPYYSEPLNIYNNGGSTAFSLPNSGASDAFIVKYTDEQITAALQNPSLDAQPKTIVSTGPQATVALSASIDNQPKSIFLLNGQSVQMSYDSVAQNWLVESLTGTLI